MIKDAIAKIAQGISLSFQEAEAAFSEIFSGEVSPAQVAAFLVALAIKGEEEHEITALAFVIRSRARTLKVKGEFIGIEIEDDPIVDTCGTGGSCVNKFNISTASAFITSSAGIKVAKHGNRAMSSNCGSADVLEALGIKIDADPALMERAIKHVGIGFLFAPLYHPALKEIAAIRKDIGIRTIFNTVGPLCNPAQATHQVLGVHTQALVPVLARVLKTLGTKKAFVVYGQDLKDEISLTGKTFVAYLNNKKIEQYTISPSDFGLKKIALSDIQVSGARESAQRIKDIFKGKPGPCRDVAIANAAACMYIVGKVKSLEEGAHVCARLIDEGKVLSKFNEFKKFINDHKEAA
jgi:anthranilate phosphoribosyltransferase